MVCCPVFLSSAQFLHPTTLRVCLSLCVSVCTCLGAKGKESLLSLSGVGQEPGHTDTDTHTHTHTIPQLGLGEQQMPQGISSVRELNSGLIEWRGEISVELLLNTHVW